LIAYAKQFSQNIGHNFTDRMIILIAITGSTTTEIGGCTSASFLGICKHRITQQPKILSYSRILD
jgi:hypothetical protein